jgi:hypothetical protein
MTRRREIWFERVYSTPTTWRPVHRDGWRAIAILVATLVGVLVAGLIVPLVGADPIWTLAAMATSIAIGVWFLLSVRGRIR